MTFMDRLNKALVRYLNEYVGIKAIEAHLSDTTSSDYNIGCDTCGHGGIEMSFDISYKLGTEKYFRSYEVSGDPIWFLPTLLEYDTEE